MRATSGPSAKQIPDSTTSADSAAPAITSPAAQPGSSARAAARNTSFGEASRSAWLRAKYATATRNGNISMYSGIATCARRMVPIERAVNTAAQVCGTRQKPTLCSRIVVIENISAAGVTATGRACAAAGAAAAPDASAASPVDRIATSTSTSLSTAT